MATIINTYLSVNLTSQEPYFRISLTDATIGTKAGKDCKDEASTKEHQKEICVFLADQLGSRSLKPKPKNRREEKALLLFKRALGKISELPDGRAAHEEHRKRLAEALEQHAAQYFENTSSATSQTETKVKRKILHTRSFAQDLTNQSAAKRRFDLLIKDKVLCTGPTLGAYLHYWRGNKEKAESLERTMKEYESDERAISLQQLRDEPQLSLVLQELLERGFRHFPEDIPRWSRELMSQMSYTTNSKKQYPAVSKPQTIEEDFGIKIAAFEQLLADLLEPLFKHQRLQLMVKEAWQSCKLQQPEKLDENSAAACCELFLTKIVNTELFDKETLNTLELEESLLLNSMVDALGHVLRAFVQDPYVTPGQEIYCRYKSHHGKEGRLIEYSIHPKGDIEVRYRNKIDFLDLKTQLPFSIILQNTLVTSLRLPKWTSTIAVEVASDTPELKATILTQLEKQGFAISQ